MGNIKKGPINIGIESIRIDTHITVFEKHTRTYPLVHSTCSSLLTQIHLSPHGVTGHGECNNSNNSL